MSPRESGRGAREGTCIGTQPQQVRVEEGESPAPASASTSASWRVSGPMAPYVFLCFMEVSRIAVSPQNDSRQARQQMLLFNELQASELLFRRPILSHRALYTPGMRLQWATDP